MKKTSPSAQGVAYLRSLEEDLSGDTLAKYFVAEDGVALANEWLKLYPGVGREICIRNRYIEDKISEYINDRGINQVMNIAAGLNTFPYRHPDSFGLQRYAELDLPKMIDFKKEFISRLVDDGVIEKLHPSVQYVPIDLLSDELEFNVEGWDWNRPTMFILEGISYYVPFDKLKNIINKLSQLSSKGSVIVMDYFLKNASKKKVFDKIMSTISKAGGEKTFTYLTSDLIEDLFSGFTIVSDRLKCDIEKDYCKDFKIWDVVSILIAQK